ncbi:MAG: hypothetical protein ACRC8A_01700 [Microcoleaceae cyanobacterium]
MNHPIKPVPKSGEIHQTLSQPTLYIFDGRRGENLVIDASHSTVEIELWSPSGQKLAYFCLDQWQGRLPETGIYRALFSPMQQEQSTAIQVKFSKSYPANLSFKDLDDWRLLEYFYKENLTIPLQSNQSEVSLEISLNQHQIQPLIIQGFYNQTLTIKAYEIPLAIESPTGQLLGFKDQHVSAVLPKAGLYRVLVIGQDYPVTTPVNIQVQ